MEKNSCIPIEIENPPWLLKNNDKTLISRENAKRKLS